MIGERERLRTRIAALEAEVAVLRAQPCMQACCVAKRAERELWVEYMQMVRLVLWARTGVRVVERAAQVARPERGVQDEPFGF